jgi:hypothetical protein
VKKGESPSDATGDAQGQGPPAQVAAGGAAVESKPKEPAKKDGLFSEFEGDNLFEESDSFLGIPVR